MDDLDKIIRDNRHVYTGTFYTIKDKEYPPWKPSGVEGRYNGSGTNAYYFGMDPEAAWREVLYHNPDASWEDYSIWGVSIRNGTFVDVGALEGTRYLRPKSGRGYEPTQELSSRLSNSQVLGFRYTSYPAYAQNASGTCFCVYQSILNLTEADFFKVDWSPDVRENI